MSEDRRLDKRSAPRWLVAASLGFIMNPVVPALAQSDPAALPPEQIVTQSEVQQLLAAGWQQLESDPRVLYKDLDGDGQIEVPAEIMAIVSEQQ